MKKILLVIICFIFFAMFSKTSYAITYEGGTAANSGGLPIYSAWFSDQSGVLIIATNYANNSGVFQADITVVVLCRNENMTFKLKVYDSDLQSYIEPQNEEGVGQKQRRFGVMPSVDAEYLYWTVTVTNLLEDVVYAKLTLVYTFDADAQPQSVFDNPGDMIDIEQYKHDLRMAKLKAAVGYALWAVIGGLATVYIVRRVN